MPRQKSLIEELILRQLEKKGTVTFNEFYALQQFSNQGIRNRMYKLMRKGTVRKIKGEKGRVKFRLKKSPS